MCFDAEGGAVESGAHANVCYGAMAARLAFETRARDVDAAGGQQFLLHGKIQGGKGEATACSRAGDDFAGESEGPAQKSRSVGDISCGNFAANDGAGDHFAAIDDGRNDYDFETKFCAKRGKQFSRRRLVGDRSGNLRQPKQLSRANRGLKFARQILRVKDARDRV